MGRSQSRTEPAKEREQGRSGEEGRETNRLFRSTAAKATQGACSKTSRDSKLRRKANESGKQNSLNIDRRKGANRLYWLLLIYELLMELDGRVIFFRRRFQLLKCEDECPVFIKVSCQAETMV